MGWFGDRALSQAPRQSGCPFVLLPFLIIGIGLVAGVVTCIR